MSARILLTGGSGMVGRNLLDLAGQHGITIMAPSSGELNLRDFAATLVWIKAERPDIVIHAAGHVGGIQANMREPNAVPHC